jgi:predicted phosphodiesterase
LVEWKAEAEALKFDEGLSWKQVYSSLRHYFPELTDKQVEEKIRRTLRRSKRYHQNAAPASKDHFVFVGGKTVHLYVISDAHVGAHGFDRKAFLRYIAKIAADPAAAVLVLGDLIDNATQNSKGCVFSQRVSPQKQIEQVIEMLMPVKDKIIFFCIGNHEERTFRQTGSDPGYTMCLGLGCLDKYNYVHGYIIIKTEDRTFKVYATHNIGSSENRLKTSVRAHPDCDLVVGGHIHIPKVVAVAKQMFDGKIKTSYAVVSRAWLKDESYSISAAYEPVSDVQPRISLDSEVKVTQ